MASKHEKVTFTGSGGEKLAARLDKPGGKVRAYALFAHCFTCTKDIFAAARIAEGLNKHGIAVLRFDFTGLGASEGDFGNTNFTSNVQDLIKAAEFLRDEYEAPKIVIGHSLGGAAVLAAAADIPGSEAICTIAAPSDPGHVAHNFDASLDEIEEKGVAEVTLVGRPFTIKKQFLDDVRGAKLKDAVTNLKKALLVFHSPLDQQVGIDNAGEIFGWAKHPKSFVSLDDADHLLTEKSDAIYVANVIASWAERYVDDLDIRQPKTLEAAQGTVRVAESGETPFTQTISVGGRHALAADEPEDVGGGDLGPSPYELLLSGLGACTTMTMRMYAKRKGWDGGRFSVQLKHDKVHAEDCADCDKKNRKLDTITREITIEGDLNSDQREKLLEIADKCPVHRTLHSEVRIKTSLKE